LQNSPLESSCVVVALTEKFSTSKPLKTFPEKSQILSFLTLLWQMSDIYILNWFKELPEDDLRKLETRV
jgi:hypothetical protein